jgi:hypothetical protein
VTDIFPGFGTKEYSLVIFLSTKEYTKNEEDALFSVVITNMIQFLLAEYGFEHYSVCDDNNKPKR